MLGKSCKDKGECNLHGKGVKNKKDVDLCIGLESRDKMVWGFVFKKEDKDGGGIKELIVFYGGIASRERDNFVLLMY